MKFSDRVEIKEVFLSSAAAWYGYRYHETEQMPSKSTYLFLQVIFGAVGLFIEIVILIKINEYNHFRT